MMTKTEWAYCNLSSCMEDKDGEEEKKAMPFELGVEV